MEFARRPLGPAGVAGAGVEGQSRRVGRGECGVEAHARSPAPGLVGQSESIGDGPGCEHGVRIVGHLKGEIRERRGERADCRGGLPAGAVGHDLPVVDRPRNEGRCLGRDLDPGAHHGHGRIDRVEVEVVAQDPLRVGPIKVERGGYIRGAVCTGLRESGAAGGPLQQEARSSMTTPKVIRNMEAVSDDASLLCAQLGFYRAQDRRRRWVGSVDEKHARPTSTHGKHAAREVQPPRIGAVRRGSRPSSASRVWTHRKHPSPSQKAQKHGPPRIPR